MSGYGVKMQGLKHLMHSQYLPGSVRTVRALLHRRLLVRGVLATGVIMAAFAGSVQDAAVEEAVIPQAELLHRQNVARENLDEKALMVNIINELDHRLRGGQRARVAATLVDEARKYDFDPLFLVAVIITESSFGPEEVSYMGARGLMQIKPSVAKAVAKRRGVAWRHADQLFDPIYNVQLGTHYLFELVADFQSVKRAIIAYNYGETALRGRIRAGEKLPTSYFRRVEKHYRTLRKKFGSIVPWTPMRFEETTR